MLLRLFSRRPLAASPLSTILQQATATTTSTTPTTSYSYSYNYSYRSSSSSIIHNKPLIHTRHMSTPPRPLSRPLKVACVQLLSGKDQAANLLRAREKVLEAAANGAGLVVLPECFNSPFECSWFHQYAESVPPRAEREQAGGPDSQKYPSFVALSAMARDANIYLVGGSIPERCASPPSALIETSDPTQEQMIKAKEQAGKDCVYIYNTSLTFNPQGTLIGVHRKIHLFDIDIPGKITFKESAVVSPGHTQTLVHIPPYGTIGIQICYDIRFPELMALYARKGAFAVIIPGAFNLTTGPLHWELLARARANDNQLYIALCSPARTGPEVEGYKAWGESMLVDPMGRVLQKADGGNEGTVYAEFIDRKSVV